MENDKIEMVQDEKEPSQNNDEKSDDVEPNLKGDRLNVALLILLCTLQGIPVGLSVAIRTYMQNMKIPYSQQAKFSIVEIPYGLKLLWAPLVDAAYSRRIGKRKTWLVPVQLFIGLSLMLVGSNLNNWLTSDINTLTLVFFCLNTLAATQDIAVDGWALTLLKKENAGYAATCNTSGQALGMAIGYVFFILFESEKFCNKWLRITEQKGGIVSMEGYLYFWGILYVLATISLAIFKLEKSNQQDKVININVTQTYRLLWRIMHLDAIKKFTVVMLTYEMVFSTLGSYVSNPKFMEYGVAKEDIALVDMSLIPIRIIIPIVVSKYTTGPKPLAVFYNSVPYRLAFGISTAILIHYTPYLVGDDDSNGNGSIYFFLIFEFHRISKMTLTVIIYLGVQSFFSQISDRRIGGTYMALLNTVWYVGVTTGRIAALGFLSTLTIRRCSTDETNPCRSKTEYKACVHESMGQCHIIVDGYFVEIAFCTLFGIVWYLILSKILKNLQSRQLSAWQVDHITQASVWPDNEALDLPDVIGGNTKKC